MTNSKSPDIDIANLSKSKEYYYEFNRYRLSYDIVSGYMSTFLSYIELY